MRVGLDVSPLVQTRAGTARYVRGLLAHLERAGDVGARAALASGGAGRCAPVARDVALVPARCCRARRARAARRPPLHDLPRRRCARRVPLVVTVHDLAVLRHPEAFNRLDAPLRSHGARAARRARADRVIAVSEFTKREPVELLGVAARADRRRAERASSRSSRPTAPRPRATTCSRSGTLEPRKNLAAERRGGAAAPASSCASSARRGWGGVERRRRTSLARRGRRRGARRALPRRALPRLPVALRGLRDPGRSRRWPAARPVVTSAAARWRRSPAAPRARRPARRRGDRRRDRGGDRAARRAACRSASSARARYTWERAVDRRRSSAYWRELGMTRRRSSSSTPTCSAAARTGRRDLRAQPAARAAPLAAARRACGSPPSTRHPELVPDGVEPSSCARRSQELRMALVAAAAAAPRRRRARALPVRAAAPLRRARPSSRSTTSRSSATPTLMAREDRLVFRRVVPRAARARRRVLAVSERTSDDLVELYGVAAGEDRRDAERRRPRLRARRRASAATTCSSSARSRRARTRSPRSRRPRGRAAARRRRAREGRGARRASCARAARDLRGYVAEERARRALPRRGLPRAAVALRGLRPAGARGDGLRHAGRRRRRAGAARGRAATRPSSPRRRSSPTAIRRALAERERLAAAGLERAQPFSLGETARRTLDVYREALGVKVSAVVVSHGHARELERSLPALAPQVDELVVVANVPGQRRRAAGGGARARERAAASVRGQRQPRHRGDDRRVRRSSRTRTPSPSRARSPRSPRFADDHPRCGSPGPQMLWPDGSLAAVAAALPDRGRHDRAPHAAAAPASRPTSTSGALPPTSARPSRWRPTGCSAASCSCAARCSTSSAAGTRASASTARTSTSATARAKAGWERWYVPAAVVSTTTPP